MSLSQDEINALLAGDSNDDALNDVPVLEGMLTDEEVDVLGEIGNISMGAVATTMYTLLEKRVSITTPRVTVFETKDVLSIYQTPFVVATIEYTKGFTGTNLLVLKVEDAALITSLLMGGDGQLEEPVELDEMHLSAMSEIMNQMMGASSTSLSKLLGTTIDIAPPKSTTVNAGFDVAEYLGDLDKVTKISFDMEIEGLLKSELIQLMPYEASLEFAKKFVDAGITGSDDAIKGSADEGVRDQPDAPIQQTEHHEAAQVPQSQQTSNQQPYQGVPTMSQLQQSTMAGQGRVVDVHPVQFQPFDSPSHTGEPKSIDIVHNIPLQVTVELGRAKKEISEILEFSLGTIVVMDKIAGDPVEVMVNGKLIARGEVVVIDDNYGVRITDIING